MERTLTSWKELYMPTISFPDDPEFKQLIRLLAIKQQKSQAELTREAYETAFGKELDGIREEFASFFESDGKKINQMERTAS